MTDTQAMQSAPGDVLRKRAHVSGRDILSMTRYVLRHKRVVVMGALIGVAAGIGVLLLTPPLYKASALVMIDSPAGQEAALRSEVEIIRSTPVLSKVAGTLGLYRDPAFTGPALFEKLTRRADKDGAVHDRVLARLAGMLDIRPLRGTGIIEMTAASPSPERAAQMANLLLSAYRERKMDEKFEQGRVAGEWMSKYLAEITARRDAAKEKLEAFDRAHGVPDDAVAGRRLADLNAQIGKARDEVASLETDFAKAIGEAGAGSARRRAAAKREAAALTSLAAESRRYGDKHPKIVELKRELARARADRAAAGAAPRRAVSARLEAARDRLKTLEAGLTGIAGDYVADARARTDRAALESDLATATRMYESFLLKYQDMTAQSGLQEDGIKIVSMATIPSGADGARRLAMVGVMALLGLGLGFAVVVVRGLFHTGFTSPNQLEGLTGYPVFAVIPSAAPKRAAVHRVHQTLIEKPATMMAEALRSLRVALRLRSGQGRGPRVVAFTSTWPDEGKTSLAVMLGVIAAKSGERVVVVDCDLRKPSVHRVFGIGNARGIQDYLGGNAGIDDVVYRKDPSGVHIVTTKAVPSYALTVLTSGRMEECIEGLRERYDLVIIDAPSSLAFADARVLARMVDQTLYVVAWNTTRRAPALSSLKAYADMGYADLALILNKVDWHEYLRENAASAVYRYGQDEADPAPMPEPA